MTLRGVDLDWEGAVAVVRLNDPATLNAITLTSLEAFEQALEEVSRRGRAMVLTGAGRAFCSGANLSGGLGDNPPGSPAYDVGAVLESRINPLMTKLRDLPIPWISAVRGAAAGAGASLALAADMIIASESAYFLQAFPRVGLVPDAGSSHLLVRTIGRPRAMELMLMGERLPAHKALEWGLINRVVADNALEEEALATAARLARGAASLALIRQLAWTAVDHDWSMTLARERDLQRQAGRTADHAEGIKAFLEKRDARFAGA